MLCYYACPISSLIAPPPHVQLMIAVLGGAVIGVLALLLHFVALGVVLGFVCAALLIAVRLAASAYHR